MKKVVVLYNKISDDPKEDELDVLQQVEVVSRSLVNLGYEPVSIPFSFDLNAAITDIKKAEPAFIFNLVESIESHDELIYFSPAILQLLKVPYTGNPLEVMFVTTNKLLTKKQLRYHGISTSEWFTLDELDKLDRNGKYILKPLWSEGSVGLDEHSVFKANDEDYLKKLRDIEHKNSFFIERFIEGREFNISVLAGEDGPEVLPPAEIIFRDYPEGKHKVVGYTAKWDADSFEYNNTVRSFEFRQEDDQLLEDLKSLCINCWNKFRMKGYVRVDIRLDENNVPFVLEINSNPCISPDAGFIAAAGKAGLDYDKVIERIIKDINNG